MAIAVKQTPKTETRGVRAACCPITEEQIQISEVGGGNDPDWKERRKEDRN